MNMNNYGIIRGRLTDDPTFYFNSDGSRRVVLRVAAQNDFVSKFTGNRESQFIPLEGFISNKVKDNGLYNRIHKGDKVSIQYEVRNNNWIDKEGKKHFDIVMHICQVSFDESKSVTDERLARRVISGENFAADTAEEG